MRNLWTRFNALLQHYGNVYIVILMTAASYFDWLIPNNLPASVTPVTISNTNLDTNRCVDWNHASRNIWCSDPDCPTNTLQAGGTRWINNELYRITNSIIKPGSEGYTLEVTMEK